MSRRDNRERGVALVEFAIALPLLAIIVFGTVDLGRAYQTYVRVKNAAREGANFAQTHPLALKPYSGGCADPDNVQYRARNDANDNTITVTMSPSPANGCASTGAPAAGSKITVTAAKDFKLLTPLVGSIVGNTINIDASVSMRVQG